MIAWNNIRQDEWPIFEAYTIVSLLKSDLFALRSVFFLVCVNVCMTEITPGWANFEEPDSTNGICNIFNNN